jgi:hypothetical protein
MDADQLLNGLGLAMGLPQLRFDERGCARLMFDGKLAINFEHDADSASIQVYSVIAPMPSEGRDAIFAMLLQGNLFGSETAGAALALDLAHREIVLCRKLALENASAASFAQAVESFVDATEHWQQRVAASREPIEPIPLETAMHGFLRG